MLLQQNLSNPNSSKICFEFSPSETLFLYSSHRCAIGLPHEKHLTGIIILLMLKRCLKSLLLDKFIN